MIQLHAATNAPSRSQKSLRDNASTACTSKFQALARRQKRQLHSLRRQHKSLMSMLISAKNGGGRCAQIGHGRENTRIQSSNEANPARRRLQRADLSVQILHPIRRERDTRNFAGRRRWIPLLAVKSCFDWRHREIASICKTCGIARSKTVLSLMSQGGIEGQGGSSKFFV